MNWCECGHAQTKHSRIDAREWCSGAPVAKRCGCVKFEFAADLESVDEHAVRRAPRSFGRRWEPDEGDREWDRRQDDSARGRMR